MSYAYNGGVDEVDYGEEEAPHETKDEMAEEEEYDDLYDDVNIGFFQAEASSAKQPDGYGTIPMYGEDVVQEKSKASALGDRKSLPSAASDIINQTTLQQSRSEFLEEKRVFVDRDVKPSVTATSLNQSNMQNYEGFRPSKEEPVQTMREQVKGTMSTVMSKQEFQYKPSIQQADSAPSLPTFVQSGKDAGQRSQMQFYLSSARKESDNVYKLEKQGSSYDSKGTGEGLVEPVLQPSHRTNVQTTTGPSRSPLTREISDAIASKERQGVNDMSYDRTRGTTVAPQRPGQRDASPHVVDNDYKQAGLQSTHQTYSSEGGTMLFIGDLHWWATDAELEAALSEYGRVKNLKFFEERVSGKSKGYCQVEFYDHGAAVACKEGMNGRKFHDRPCVVALGNARSIQQMGHQQEKKTQAQIQTQQEPYRRGMGGGGTSSGRGGGGGGGGGSSYQDRDSNRGYGRMGAGRTGHGQGRGGQPSSGGRGRGSYMGKGMSSGGMPSATGMPYGQAPMGGHQSAMMMHQAMMGQGYDASYMPMGRGGAAFGGYVIPGPPFSGIVGPFPGLGPGGLPGVAPHVNPAFFGRSVAPTGMGLMSGGGMEGAHGMWGDASVGGWSGEEHDRRGGRDGSFAEDGTGMEYGYGNESATHEKTRASGGAWDKESGDLPDRHRAYDRDGEWERERYREKEKEGYKDNRDRDRDREKDEDWERDRNVRMRSKSRVIEEEEDDPRQRPREDDYGKRRRVTDRE